MSVRFTINSNHIFSSTQAEKKFYNMEEKKVNQNDYVSILFKSSRLFQMHKIFLKLQSTPYVTGTCFQPCLCATSNGLAAGAPGRSTLAQGTKHRRPGSTSTTQHGSLRFCTLFLLKTENK